MAWIICQMLTVNRIELWNKIVLSVNLELARLKFPQLVEYRKAEAVLPSYSKSESY